MIWLTKVSSEGMTVSEPCCGRFVSENAAGLTAPVTDAVTAKLPAVPFAVSRGAVAIPLLSVATVAALLNVPLGPEGGAVKDTAAPPTGLPARSRTCACSSMGNGIETVVDCGVPEIAVIVDGVPAMIWNVLLTAGG